MENTVESLTKVLESMVAPIREFGSDAWNADPSYKYTISQALSLAEYLENLGIASYLSRIIIYNVEESNLDYWRQEGRKALEPQLLKISSFSNNGINLIDILPNDSKFIRQIMKQGRDFFKQAQAIEDNETRAIGFATARQSFIRIGYAVGVAACDFHIRPLIEETELKSILDAGIEIENEFRSEYSDYF